MTLRTTTQAQPTPAQRIAMAAVLNGAVRLDAGGCRTYPDGVSGNALTACDNHGWFRWDEERRRAVITEAGRTALA